jgi:pyruvate/2-oxoglutarate dehydrogenase complex dihydrolipoamide dehydrogenase (E3) component
VAGVERELVGGECPYWGCIPSKMMVRGSGLLAEGRRIPGMAGEADVRADYAPVAARIRTEATDRWDDRVAVERLESKGGHFVRGSARLDGPGRVVVGDRVLEATRGVVVATGASPVIPPVPGLDSVPYWTNRDAVRATAAPRSLVVLGGGAIGVEMAQALRRFGSEITVIEAADRLLAAEEPETGTMLAGVLQAEGVDVRVGRRAIEVTRGDGEVRVRLDDGGTVAAEHLLVATGRRPATRELGLGSVVLDDHARAVPVDEHMRAGERLWAVGDVTGIGAFTHIAMYQAGLAVESILTGGGPGARYHALPRVTFTDPEVGSVGITEAQARERGLSVRVGISQVATSARGWIHGPGNAGFFKLVEDADQGVLVGATSAGPLGGEVLSMLTLAVQEHIPVERLRRMIYAYPTFHRGIEDALRELKGR